MSSDSQTSSTNSNTTTSCVLTYEDMSMFNVLEFITLAGSGRIRYYNINKASASVKTNPSIIVDNDSDNLFN